MKTSEITRDAWHEKCVGTNNAFIGAIMHMCLQVLSDPLVKICLPKQEFHYPRKMTIIGELIVKVYFD